MSWEYVNLSEVAEFKNGVNFDKSSFGLGMKVINVGDFKDKLYPNYLTLPQINPDGVVKESDLLKNGDILFVRSNGNKELVGRSMFIDKIEEPITFSGFCIRCRFKSDKVYPLFYAYLFKSQIIRNTISNSANGTNITNLNQTLLNNLKVPKINISTQKLIVSILSTYDDLIENNLKRIKLLEETAQNIYKEWFVNFRFPNYENTEFDAESGLPVGWEIKKIEDCIKIMKGKKPKKEYSTIGENRILYLLVDVLERRELRFTENESVQLASEGETLMLMDGSRSGLVFKSLEGAIGSTLAVFRIKNVVFGINYCFNYFKFREVEIISKNTGSAIPHANKSYIYGMDIPIPSDKISTEFETITSKIYQQIEILSSQNQKLKEARDILLPRLMNRTIEV